MEKMENCKTQEYSDYRNLPKLKKSQHIWIHSKKKKYAVPRPQGT